jgi:hypothetical protein
MSEQPKKRRWLRIFGLLTPVLYVASFGPACWLVFGKAWFGPSVIFVGYEPIRYGAELSRSFGNLMDQYANSGLPAGTRLTVSGGRWSLNVKR